MSPMSTYSGTYAELVRENIRLWQLLEANELRAEGLVLERVKLVGQLRAEIERLKAALAARAGRPRPDLGHGTCRGARAGTLSETALVGACLG